MRQTDFTNYSLQELEMQTAASKKAYEAGKLNKDQVKAWQAMSKELNRRKQAVIDFNTDQCNLF